MQVTKIPPRSKKTKGFTAEEIKACHEAIAKLKPGQCVAPEPNVSYDTEGKARSAARTMALLIKEAHGYQPRTHVLPVDDEHWTGAVSQPKVTA